MATHGGQQDPAIKEILDFWFGLDSQEWFGEKHDKYIIENFGPLVEKARCTNGLDAWSSSPSGSLALIIVLDQFTRNIFRASNHSEPGLAFSGDAKAREIATDALMRGWDKKIQEERPGNNSVFYRTFFYLPFQHHEDMKSQILSCSLYESMGLDFEVTMLQKELRGEELTEEEKGMRKQMKEAIPFATRHRDCIAEHGRFPKRNEALGRETSKAERDWLESHPMGF